MISHRDFLSKSWIVKMSTITVICFLLFLGVSDSFAREKVDEVTVVIDGDPLAIDAAPIMDQGRLLVPARPIFEGLGARMAWDDTNRVASGIMGDDRVDIPINSREVYVNQVAQQLDVPGQVFGGRTYIPLRFSGEAFGANVTWDQKTRTVEINSAPIAEGYAAAGAVPASQPVQDRVEPAPSAALREVSSDYRIGELHTLTVDVGQDGAVLFHVDTERGYVVAANDALGLINSENKKIMVERSGERYFYDLDNRETFIPLQLGSGEYQIALLRNTTGQSYTVVQRKRVDVSLTRSQDPYLHPTWPVFWSDAPDATRLARQITEGMEDDREKVEAIYEYIINHIDYDYGKIHRIDNRYVPDIDRVLEDKTGICYDYAALFAGMLRSLDIPTKLVKGYKEGLNEYHAWNEVYLRESNNWLVIDTTYDAALRHSRNIDMVKDRSLYDIERLY